MPDGNVTGAAICLGDYLLTSVSDNTCFVHLDLPNPVAGSQQVAGPTFLKEQDKTI